MAAKKPMPKKPLPKMMPPFGRDAEGKKMACPKCGKTPCACGTGKKKGK